MTEREEADLFHEPLSGDGAPDCHDHSLVLRCAPKARLEGCGRGIAAGTLRGPRYAQAPQGEVCGCRAQASAGGLNLSVAIIPMRTKNAKTSACAMTNAGSLVW